MLMPAKEAAAKSPIATGGRGGISESSCAPTGRMTSALAISGLPGRHRSAIALPTTPPPAPSVRISPQAPAPAEFPLGDEWPEHGESRAREVAEREADEVRPEPRPAGHFAPALHEIGEEALSLGAFGRRPRAQQDQKDCTGDEAGGVDRERPARADSDDEQPCHRRAENERRALGQADQRVRLLQATSAGDLGDQSRRGGAEERGGAAHDRRRDHEHPELERSGDQSHRDERLGGRTKAVADEHDPPSRQAVRPHAADEDEEHACDRERGEHQPEVAGRPVQIRQHREGQRDGNQRIADRRRGLAEPEQAEGTFLERAEPSLQREHPRKIYARAVEIHPGAVVTAVSRNPTHALGKPNRERIRLLTGLGVDGDAHMGATVKHRSRVARDPTQPNLRQVHLIHAELHDELRAAGFELAAGQMGENVTTRGIHLLRLPAGSRLHLGDTAVVEVTGLRNPCSQLDHIQPGLMAATLGHDEHGNLVRKAGIMGIVLADGDVRSGDPIRVELPPGPHRPLAPV